MKMTLLEMTQDILNDMDSDQVNSIDDTFESQQVAQIIRTTYSNMIDTRNWPKNKSLITFQSLGDVTKPTHVLTPDNLKELEWIKYDTRTVGETRLRYTDVKYLEPELFLRKQYSLNNDNANVDVVVDLSGIQLLIVNDSPPTYWTSFDDKHIVFDSYDSVVNDTIIVSKISAFGYSSPSWSHVDDFIPELPDEGFSALLQEAKSTAFLVLKQMANTKAEQQAIRSHRWLSRKAWSTNGGIKFPDYGRKRGRGFSRTKFKKD